MVEKYANKKNKTALWVVITLFVSTLIALLISALCVKQIEANAFTDYYDLGITTEVCPAFDYSNVNTASGSAASNVFFSSGWLFGVLGFEEVGMVSQIEANISVTYPNLFDSATAYGVANGGADTSYVKVTNTYSSGFHAKSMPYTMVNTTYAQLYYWYAFEDTPPSGITPVINWYDSGNNYIASSALYVPTSQCVEKRWYVVDMEVSGSAIPSGAVKYGCSIELPKNSTIYLTSLYLGHANKSNGEHVTTKSDIYNMLEAGTIIEYNEHNASYWYNLYEAKNEALELAQGGATLEGVLGSITSTPINLLKDLLSFEIEILGIDVKQLLIFILSLAVVGVVIKIIIGRS